MKKTKKNRIVFAHNLIDTNQEGGIFREKTYDFVLEKQKTTYLCIVKKRKHS